MSANGQGNNSIPSNQLGPYGTGHRPHISRPQYEANLAALSERRSRMQREQAKLQQEETQYWWSVLQNEVSHHGVEAVVGRYAQSSRQIGWDSTLQQPAHHAPNGQMQHSYIPPAVNPSSIRSLPLSQDGHARIEEVGIPSMRRSNPVTITPFQPPSNTINHSHLQTQAASHQPSVPVSGSPSFHAPHERLIPLSLPLNHESSSLFNWNNSSEGQITRPVNGNAEHHLKPSANHQSYSQAAPSQPRSRNNPKTSTPQDRTQTFLSNRTLEPHTQAAPTTTPGPSNGQYFKFTSDDGSQTSFWVPASAVRQMLGMASDRRAVYNLLEYYRHAGLRPEDGTVPASELNINITSSNSPPFGAPHRQQQVAGDATGVPRHPPHIVHATSSPHPFQASFPPKTIQHMATKNSLQQQTHREQPGFRISGPTSFVQSDGLLSSQPSSLSAAETAVQGRPNLEHETPLVDKHGTGTTLPPVPRNSNSITSQPSTSSMPPSASLSRTAGKQRERPFHSSEHDLSVYLNAYQPWNTRMGLTAPHPSTPEQSTRVTSGPITPASADRKTLVPDLLAQLGAEFSDSSDEDEASTQSVRPKGSSDNSSHAPESAPQNMLPIHRGPSQTLLPVAPPFPRSILSSDTIQSPKRTATHLATTLLPTPLASAQPGPIDNADQLLELPYPPQNTPPHSATPLFIESPPDRGATAMIDDANSHEQVAASKRFMSVIPSRIITPSSDAPSGSGSVDLGSSFRTSVTNERPLKKRKIAEIVLSSPSRKALHLTKIPSLHVRKTKVPKARVEVVVGPLPKDWREYQALNLWDPDTQQMIIPKAESPPTAEELRAWREIEETSFKLGSLRRCLWIGCSAILESGEKLQAHLNIVHGIVEGRSGAFICRWLKCPKRYTTLENLRSHLRVHCTEWLCCTVQDCEKRFARAREVARHIRRDHKGEDESHSRFVPCPVRRAINEAQPLPETVPSYLSTGLRVYACPISQERRAKLGPWVLQNIYGKLDATGASETQMRVSQRLASKDDNESYRDPATAFHPFFRVGDQYNFLSPLPSNVRFTVPLVTSETVQYVAGHEWLLCDETDIAAEADIKPFSHLRALDNTSRDEGKMAVADAEQTLDRQ